MFRATTQRMIGAFATQFESDGALGYLYRHGGRGAGIPVSQPERKAFINIYGLESRWLFNRFLVGTVILFFVFLVLRMGFDLRADLPAYLVLMGGFGLLLAAYSFVHRRIYDAPCRALADRASVGPERSREEAKAMAVARQSWKEILVGLPIFVGGFALQALTHDVLHGWGRVWWLFLALGLGATGSAALRKWRNQIG
jgi:hypothetical protein